MRTETISLHGGYSVDPTTRAVAVPIYQTVAYEFDSAEHAAALFNLEAEGFRYSRISNPTAAVLGGCPAWKAVSAPLCVASGQAAIFNAILGLADVGRNLVRFRSFIVAHTLFNHVLPRQGVQVRFAASIRCRHSAGID